ncbi:MAG: ABC transporter ATP-binding protein [Lachnospiraceae bacterium]|nr:ABC transporter ATP-binding protein [Lachnospiraceae bacterium]
MKGLWRIFGRSMKAMGRRLPVYLIAIFFMSTGFSAFAVMEGLLMKSVVDIAQSGRYADMGITFGTIILAGAVLLIVYRFAAVTYNVEAKRMFGKLSEEVLDESIHLPYAYYEKHHSGEIISKLSYDLGKMGDIYGSRFRRVVMPVLEVIVYMIPMCILDFRLSLCLMGVNVVLLLLDMLTLEPMHKVRKRLSEHNGRMTNALSNLLQGMEQVRMNRAGYEYVEHFQEENRAYARAYRGQIWLSSILESADQGFHLLASLFFLMVGVFFVDKGYSTLGGLAAIYTMYVRFSNSFRSLGEYLPELVGCLSNAENIFEFLAEEREQSDKAAGGKVEGVNGNVQNERMALRIEGLNFAYDRGTEVLSDFSLSVEEGECLAITGPSGCGKTTLSKLLLGLYGAPESGEIIVGGRSMRDMSFATLRKQIAYVPQESYLFQGTVKENIGCAKEGVSEEEIIAAAKIANADGFIRELPEGYETVMGERGRNLSGGQRQRIAIARAVLKDAPILLLDEATSALDQDSERLINEALRRLKGKKTIVMIAHRPATIALADRVCRMG